MEALIKAGADLRWADLSGYDLEGANLEGAKLRGTHFYQSNLRGANLRGADLRFANLCEADLSGADLSGARLVGANLAEANLDGAILTGANLRCARREHEASARAVTLAFLGACSAAIVAAWDADPLTIIELYEDNAGGLTVWNPGREYGFTGLQVVAGTFAQHAEAMADGCDDGWQVERVSSPAGELVATWDGTEGVRVVGNVGSAAAIFAEVV